MNVDFYWVREGLIQRKPPHEVTTMSHPFMVLPVRRNMMDDGYALVVRCTSGTARTPTGTRSRPPIHAFEREVKWTWTSRESSAQNIAAFYNLFPVRLDVLTCFGGRGFLDEIAVAEISTFIAGLLWDQAAGIDLLPTRTLGDFVPPAVRRAKPGDIVVIDGSPGIVVSNTIVNQHHKYGILSIVPLVECPGEAAPARVSVGSYVAAPEFLKICQAYDGVHTVHLDGRRLDAKQLDLLVLQLRELLEWGEMVPPTGVMAEVRVLPMLEASHACLFSTNPRPRKPGIPIDLPLPLTRPIAGAGDVFEPIRIDSSRYEGSAGALRVELWDRQGAISIQFVTEDGKLPIINLISVLSQNGSINVTRGPIWPEDWIFSLPIGSLSEVQDQAIEVAIRAPGIAAEYTFRLTRTAEEKDASI